MKIIADSFNKEGRCSSCGSIFFYNLNDIENIKMEYIMAKETAEKILKQSNLELAKWFEMPGQMIKCPCCSRYIIIKKPSIAFISDF